ncbi:hypothetical protein FRC12_010120 [Ceratobasidium sp. 428]|nr:hypothetical protein FRC12_010120 [Ceratobasidium sp. 428]
MTLGHYHIYYIILTSGMTIPFPQQPSELGFYFTSLHNIYYYDLGGTVYYVDDSLSRHRANDVCPNPTTLGADFLVDRIFYRMDESFRLRWWGDFPGNPWILKETYDNVQEAKANLEAETHLSEPFSLSTLELPNMMGDLEVGNFGLVSQEVRDNIFASVPQTVPHEQSQFSLLQASGSSSCPGSSLDGNPLNKENSLAVDKTPAPPTSSHADPTFGSKEDIDRWVDSLKSQRKCKNSVKPELRCPLGGCGIMIRRPLALKEHLYAHYNIKRE